MVADTIELHDPRALRAYAHPIRMTLMGLLRREGPLTATRAGELIGESSGTTSFHLRQLAKYGLVEEAGGGVGRQKPWRATAMFTHVPEVATAPETAQAADHLRAVLARRYYDAIVDWLGRRSSEPARWQRAAPFGDTMLYVTAAELAALDGQIRDLLRPYVDRLADPATRPRGSRLVTFLRFGLPAAP